MTLWRNAEPSQQFRADPEREFPSVPRASRLGNAWDTLGICSGFETLFLGYPERFPSIPRATARKIPSRPQVTYAPSALRSARSRPGKSQAISKRSPSGRSGNPEPSPSRLRPFNVMKRQIPTRVIPGDPQVLRLLGNMLRFTSILSQKMMNLTCDPMEKR